MRSAPDILDELWRRYFKAIEPLRATGKLGAILFKFAPRITMAPADMAHVEHCAERKRSIARVTHEYARGGVKSRTHDMGNYPPELTIVRLHGRNAET